MCNFYLGKINRFTIILLYILERLLILWHPFIPFVTEEIWSNFGDDLLMIQKWPTFAEASAGTALKDKINKEILYPFWKFEEIVMNIRNLRADFKIEPGKKVNVTIVPGKKDGLEYIRFGELQDNIIHLARLNKLETGTKKPAG